MNFSEKLASVSWTFWVSLFLLQVGLTGVFHRLMRGTWDAELMAYSGAGVIAAIVLMRLWARRQLRNRPST